jgi:hypothetical protein
MMISSLYEPDSPISESSMVHVSAAAAASQSRMCESSSTVAMYDRDDSVKVAS